MFDDETAAVKNEVGGGNLSTLERHPGRGRQGGTKCDAEGFTVCGHGGINAVSPPMHQTDGREDK